MSSHPPVDRITMFKISNLEHRDRVLQQYKTLVQTAVKDGKPYITSLTAGPVPAPCAEPEPRAKGFTLAVKAEFASREDMEYYDTHCEAHKALKEVAKPGIEDMVTVWYERVF
ncbi:hypothetical protein FQN54_000334 [Arachnomyces sp. PD_36]|nr:hypothetical protein FQN54_000334 [Arachnomyces sp. PD_36]